MSPRSNLYPHGIINPNYPGFQHLAHTLSSDYSDPNTFSYSDVEEDFFDSNNNGGDEPEKLVEHKSNEIKIVGATEIKLLEEDDEDLMLTKLSLSSTPPDILYEHTLVQEKHQPDLIKNLDLPNDDKPLHTNIVGDFGKEVEEEFGVIGYNLGIFKARDLPSLYQKTIDAALSTASDKAFEAKTKLVPHDERPVLSFNVHETGGGECKKSQKQTSRLSAKISCETLAVNQACNGANNNNSSSSSNHKTTLCKAEGEAG